MTTLFFFISQDHTTNAAVSANTVAHEMGHNLGFYHNSKLKALFPIYVAKFYWISVNLNLMQFFLLLFFRFLNESNIFLFFSSCLMLLCECTMCDGCHCSVRYLHLIVYFASYLKCHWLRIDISLLRHSSKFV